MPFTQTDIANLALQRVGIEPIANITDNTPQAKACNIAYSQALKEVSRAEHWNCLKARMQLALTTPPGVTSSGTSTSSITNWQPATAYVSGQMVNYVTTQYIAAYNHTSGTDFTTDLTAGKWIQDYTPASSTNPGNTGNLYEWKYAYALPPDWVSILELNGNDCTTGRGVGSLFEIYQQILYTNAPSADVKYIAYKDQPGVWDSLFTDCVVTVLASKVASVLRKDGGAQASQLLAEYKRVILPAARIENSSEGKPRRYDPTRESKLLNVRYYSTNG